MCVYINVCMCIYIHIYVYIYIYIYVCIYIYIYVMLVISSYTYAYLDRIPDLLLAHSTSNSVSACLCVCVWVCVCVSVWVCLCLCECVDVCVLMCLCAHVLMCLCVCACLWQRWCRYHSCARQVSQAVRCRTMRCDAVLCELILYITSLGLQILEPIMLCWFRIACMSVTVAACAYTQTSCQNVSLNKWAQTLGFGMSKGRLEGWTSHCSGNPGPPFETLSPGMHADWP